MRSLFFKLSSKNTKIAENAENAKMPRDAILFPANFKTLFVCFVRKLLDIYLADVIKAISALMRSRLPFISYHAAIPGWAVISVQYKNKATAAP
jgi:hypothetical protein